jgi:WhiB family transcriptional regulator, redox-sensing transcriptional regulator
MAGESTEVQAPFRVGPVPGSRPRAGGTSWPHAAGMPVPEISDRAEDAAGAKSALTLVEDDFDAMFLAPTDTPQWQDRALCAQTDPEAFFPEKGGSTREAKRICLGCEVRDECLEYALANDERFGIWGGLSERERRRLKRGIS